MEDCQMEICSNNQIEDGEEKPPDKYSKDEVREIVELRRRNVQSKFKSRTN